MTQTFAPTARADAIYRTLGATGAALLTGFLILYFARAHLPFDDGGYLVGRDFVNDWMGGRAALARDPGQWYDIHAYNSALRELFGPNYPPHNWSYPPTLLLFLAPLGLISYLSALAVWTAVGFTLYLWIAAEGDLRWDRLLLLAASPAVIVNLFAGQNGFFTAALLIGGLTQLDRRPMIAGALFGLMTIKPQLGLLLPVMLLLTGRWRCFAAAVATALILAGAATMVFGADVWADYVKFALPMQSLMMTKGVGPFLAMSPTAFMNMRAAGAPISVAYLVQGAVSIFALCAAVWTFWRKRDPILSEALLVVLCFLVTPYAFSYDMIICNWLILRLKDYRWPTGIDHCLMIALWMLPIVALVLGLLGIPGSCVILIATAARLIWRLAAANEAAREDVSLATTQTSATKAI